MSDRQLILSRHPARVIGDCQHALLICPGDIAARQLGRPPLSLDEISAQILERNGITLAPEHVVLRVAASLLKQKLKTEDTTGMARAMLPAINTLLRSGADLFALSRAIRGRPLLITETADLLRGHLAENHMCARPDAITQAGARHFEDTFVAPIVVYGYARLSMAECLLVDKIAASGSRIVLPGTPGNPLFGDNHSAAEFLKKRGWNVTYSEVAPTTPGEQAADAFLGLPADIKGITAQSFPTPEEEVRAVLRHIKLALLNGKYGVHDVALVARTESTYGELVREIAWEYEMPVVTHYGISLLETRAGQWLNSLLEIAEEGTYPFEATARLFQHALGNRLRFKGDTERLDSKQWETARKGHSRGAEMWDQHGLDVSCIAWPREDTRKGWCDRIRAAMVTLNLRELSLERAQDLIAYRRLTEALDEFALPTGELLSRSEFTSQLQDLLRITSVPSGAGSAGLEVHTPLSLYGARVPHLFVLGEAEGELPRPVSEDPMLDFHDRKVLTETGHIHLESAAQAARRETLSFYSLLLAAGSSLSFSYQRMEGTAAVRPSPFIARIGLNVIHQDAYPEIAASRAELLMGELAAAPAKEDNDFTRQARLAVAVVERRESCAEIDAYTGDVGVPQDPEKMVFSPSQFNTFGQCSYHWFANRLLKMRDPDEADDDLAADVKGTLFHAVLAKLADECKDMPDVTAQMLIRLEAAFDEAASGAAELLRLPGWAGRRYELIAQLQKAISGEEFLPAGSHILLTEQKVTGQIHGLRVVGTVDRIDSVEGGLKVVDYKTSSTSPKGVKDDSGNLKTDVQLPVYMHLAAQAARGHGSVVSGAYYSLTKGSVLDTATPDIEPLIPLTDKIKQSIRMGLYPVDPDSKEQACSYCELDILCRKGPYLHRKSEETQ